jgi:hypothetical protein
MFLVTMGRPRLPGTILPTLFFFFTIPPSVVIVCCIRINSHRLRGASRGRGNPRMGVRAYYNPVRDRQAYLSSFAGQPMPTLAAKGFLAAGREVSSVRHSAKV